MPLPHIAGHEALRQRFTDAIGAGRLPQTLLFEGPKGVGKQRLALWLAQALLCETAPGQPCGKCASCRQVDNLSHPDLHWFIPVELTKKGADADKQIDLVEEAIGDILAERREDPFYAAPAGLAGGLHLGRRRAVGRPEGPGGGCERRTEGARGATADGVHRPDDERTRCAPAHNPVPDRPGKGWQTARQCCDIIRTAIHAVTFWGRCRRIETCTSGRWSHWKACRC